MFYEYLPLEFLYLKFFINIMFFLSMVLSLFCKVYKNLSIHLCFKYQIALLLDLFVVNIWFCLNEK